MSRYERIAKDKKKTPQEKGKNYLAEDASSPFFGQ
jgi:hypothetical protein